MRSGRDTSDAVRFIDGIDNILGKILRDDREKIDRASSIVSEAILSGHRAYAISEGHAPPLANVYGSPGNPNFFLPYDLILGHLSYFPTTSMKGDVLVAFGQFDNSPFMNELVSRCKSLGAYTIFVGTPSDRDVIPLTMPMLSLPEICDLSIDTFTPPREGLLKFTGLDVEVCPTGGIVSILLFHILNIEIAEKVSKRITSSLSNSRGRKKTSAGRKSPGAADTPLLFRGLAGKKR